MRYFFILLVGLFCLASSQSTEVDGQTDTNTELESVLHKKAVAGHANAQYALGLSYSIGKGVPEDFVEAYAWVNIAAAQGQKEAIENRNLVKEPLDRASLSKAQERSREYFKKYVLQVQ